MLESTVDRPRVVAVRSRQRSAVGNGSKLLAGVDGRTTEARRFEELLDAFASDLGGMDKLSEAEKALVRQAASTTVAAERLQGALLRGETVDDEQLVRLSNVTARLLMKLSSRKRGYPGEGSSTLSDNFSRPPSSLAERLAEQQASSEDA